MVRIEIRYEGSLRCRATHTPSGTELVTDAPVDNQGQGASFSPTDLAATSLGTCILTTMGIVAQRHGWPLEGATATVVKQMVADPARRIGQLEVTLEVPHELEARAREALERAALTCPVHRSLSGDVARPLTIHWARASKGTSPG
jgi:putative redox protein